MSIDVNAERLRILDRIEQGEISVTEGMRLIAALPANDEPQVVDRLSSVIQDQPSPVLDPEIEKWKRWWVIPLIVGVVVTVLSGLLMYSALTAAGIGIGFVCAGLPFMIGVAIIALASGSRTSRWIHVRVHTGQKTWPRNIAISIPLYATLIAWLLRTIGPYIPQLRHTALDELILALNESTSSERPFYVDVAEGESGERIQVYIG